MAECPSVAADRYFASEEASNEAACNGTALENGFTSDQADNCDNCSLHCIGCPWASPFEQGQAKGAGMIDAIGFVLGLAAITYTLFSMPGI